MTAINKELYDALIAAGAPDDKASAAAATVRPAEDLVTKVDFQADMAALRAEIAALRAEMYKLLGAPTLLLIGVMVGLKLFS